MKVIEVKRSNVVVKVYVRHRVREGQESTEFVVADLSGGSRKLRTFADLEKAKKRRPASRLRTVVDSMP